MKTEELLEQGFTAEQIKFVMAENGKDVNNAKAEVQNLTNDLNNWKNRAETAEASLSAYGGKSVEDFNNEIATLQTQLNEEKTGRGNDALRYQLEYSIRSKLNADGTVKGDMREFVYGMLDKSGALSMVEGQLTGYDEQLKEIKEKYPSAFESSENRTKFTKPFNHSNVDLNATPSGRKAFKTIEERMADKNAAR